jgi:acyl-CoA hydrolase
MEARSHNVYTGKQELVLKTNMTFVRIDDGGSPIPISDRVKNKINKIIEEKIELV